MRSAVAELNPCMRISAADPGSYSPIGEVVCSPCRCRFYTKAAACRAVSDRLGTLCDLVALVLRKLTCLHHIVDPSFRLDSFPASWLHTKGRPILYCREKICDGVYNVRE